MKPGLARRAGVVFGAGLLVSMAVAVADLAIMDAAQAGQVYRGSGTTATRDGVVAITRPQIQPGDLLVVELIEFPRAPLGPARVYVVEHGEGDIIRAGGRPAHVYFESPTVQPEPCCPDNLRFRMVRPEPPAGVDGGHLDVVWVYPYAPGIRLPTTDEGWVYFQAHAKAVAGGGGNRAIVVQAYGPAFHDVASVVLVPLGAMTLAAGVVWFRELHRSFRRPSTGIGSAALVDLVDSGQRWMATLRALLLGLGPALFLVGYLGGAFVVGEFTVLQGSSATWAQPMTLAVTAAWFAAAAAWAVLTWRVHRSLRRWRRAASEPPGIL